MSFRKNILYVASLTLIGFALTFAIYHLSLEREKEESFNAFSGAGLARIGMVKAMLQEEETSLVALDAIHEVLPNFTHHEFSTVASHILSHQESIFYLVWAPLITNDQRQNAEALIQSEHHHASGIKDLDENKQPITATIRDFYFPVYHAEPAENMGAFIGTDMYSWPEGKTAIDRVMKTGKASITGRVPATPKPDEDDHAVLVFAPVYKVQEPTVLDGVIYGAIFIDKALNKKLAHFSQDAAVSLTITDITDTPPTPIYTSPNTSAQDIAATPFNLSEDIDVMGRKWQVNVYPVDDAFPIDMSPPQTVLFGGIFLTLLLSIITFLITGRHAQMEKTVLEKTRELQASFTQLSKAKDDAIVASKAKSDFLANMSHEIRTPLNGVLAAAELLSDSSLNGSQRNYVDIIRTSGDMLLGTINDILDLSKLEAGKMTLYPSVLEIQHSTEVIASIFRAPANAKKLLLTYEINPPVPTFLLADHTHLRQVIVNLINNAIKYTETGRIDVHVHFLPRNHLTYMHVDIKDTGPGIPAEAQKTIFEKFTQLNRVGSAGGTGLGLSICNALVQLMEGEIGVTSDGKNGSTFWFEVPVVIIDDPHAFNQATKSVNDEAKDIAGTRALLVEDVETNRLVAQEMLRRLGCAVDIVGNGKQALELVEKKTFDVIFMDCQMPVMNGFDATRAIRERGYTTPIVALTAHAFSEEIQKCFAVGMNDFISKPFNSAILKQTLQKWVTPKTKTTETAPVATPSEQPPEEIEQLPALDPAMLHDIFEAIPEKAPQIIQLALKDGARLYGEIVAAFDKKDLEEIKEAAHALKSAAQQIGGRELARSCLALEIAGRENSFDKATAGIASLHETYPRFVKAIEEQIISIGTDSENA